MATLRIAHAKDIPECSPNLMPFSIKYDGPAPVSTYFRVAPANESVGAPPESDAEKDASNPAKLPLNALESPHIASKTRFTSAFRGRTMSGLKADLPRGYAGIILKVEGEGNSKPKREPSLKEKIKKKARGRTTRSATKEDEEDETLEQDDMDVDEVPVLEKVLAPAGQFSSFVLWHPDRPVDEGQDEYLRTLDEWVQLASVIHQEED